MSTHAFALNITVERAPYAYVENITTNNLSRCLMSTSDGTLIDCAVVADGLSSPLGIAINSSKTYLYTLNFNNYTIDVCSIAPGTGTLNCDNSGSIGLNGNLQGIALDPSGAYVYVPRNDDVKIYKCSITGSGATVSGCVNSLATGLNPPEQVAMNPAGNKLYAVAFTTTYVCPVSNCAGDLGSCVDTTAGSSHNYPTYARGVAITADGLYAYISGTDSVSGCKVHQDDGTFYDCVLTTIASSIIGIGADIDVNVAGTLAYVATDKTATSGSYVALCNLAESRVTGCSSTGTGADPTAGTSHGIGLLQ